MSSVSTSVAAIQDAVLPSYPYHPLVGSVLVVLRTASSNQMAYFRCACQDRAGLCGGESVFCFIYHYGFYPKRAFVACTASSNTSWMAATLVETELIKTDIKWD